MMIRRVLAARALRAFADGFIAVLLPAYLLALGLGQLEVGFISTATLFGSALATLAVGRWGHRFSIRRLLLGTSLLMAATGLAFAGLSSLWPLLIVAFVGTLNPSSGDVSVFLPLDHTLLAAAAPADARTSVFARYSFAGSLFGAIGALAAAVPEWLAARGALSMLEALRAMFVLYGAVGVAVWALYLRLPDAHVEETKPAAPLGPSRSIVWRLAGLFSLDSFAGGLIVNSLLALWLFERFGMSLTAAGAFFFWTGLLSAVSQLAAPVVARDGWETLKPRLMRSLVAQIGEFYEGLESEIGRFVEAPPDREKRLNVARGCVTHIDFGALRSGNKRPAYGLGGAEPVACLAGDVGDPRLGIPAELQLRPVPRSDRRW